MEIINKPVLTEDLKFSILMPTYNGSKWVRQTINSILRQSYSNFELIISDDCSTDNTLDIVKKYKDNRIKIFKNDVNFGYPGNLEKARMLSSMDSDILYLMGQDDILAKDALLKTYKAFKIGEEIGVVSRAYYHFTGNNFQAGNRNSAKPISSETITIINSFDDFIKENNSKKDEEILSYTTLISSIGQLSGLSYRKCCIDIPFHKDIFVSHIYPFLSILKKYKAVYLNDYIVAVRIESSQCIHVSSIYKVSPLKSWVDMFNNIFNDKKYDNLRKILINDSSKKIEGILQIKNFGQTKYYYREILLYIKYRPENLISIRFWTYTLGSLVMPKRLLIKIIGYYKNNILAKGMKNVKIKY
jgi:glycosyltransferase involved in cell wall biosynthesis